MHEGNLVLMFRCVTVDCRRPRNWEVSIVEVCIDITSAVCTDNRYVSVFFSLLDINNWVGHTIDLN
jgi:hypothetical protein